jgi:DNA polymerase
VIGEYHGKVIEKEIKSLGKLVFFPCYHPAAALYNGSLRGVLEEDFRKIPKLIKLIKK